MSTSAVFCRHCGSSRPLSEGTSKFCCAAAQMAFQEEPVAENRIRHPQINGEIATWDDVLEHIQEQILAAQQHSTNAVGLYLGTPTWYRGLDWTQSILMALKLGTTSLFTDQCLDDAARLLVTEWMLGHAAPLLTDLGRAHNIIILGDNPHLVGWGALQPDHDYESAILHSQSTKQTKVSFVSSTSVDSSFNTQSNIVIRPGTETFFLLGMLHLVVNNGWYDKQYVEKYTTGLQTLQQWVKPFTVAQCANACGVSEADISGLTLKWTRSAMGLIHLTPGALRTQNSTLGAWAWLALHTLTANTLRPGGIYETVGAVDILPVLVGLRTANAPKSAVGGQPLLLMQNMASQLLTELEAGNLKTMIFLDTPQYPQHERLLKAIENIPCSIVIAETESALTKTASIVLPRTTCWEEDDIALHRNSTFSTQCLPTSKPIHPVLGDARSAYDILSTLTNQLNFKWRNSELGITNRILANQISKGDLRNWSARAWGLLHEDDLEMGGSMNYKGEHDRALWRPSEDSINLAPEQLSQIVQQIQWPTHTETASVLHTSHCSNATEHSSISIEVHPKSGYSTGQPVQLETTSGVLNGVIVLNDAIHPSTVLCSSRQYSAALNLLPSVSENWSGTPIFNGVSCTITAQ